MKGQPTLKIKQTNRVEVDNSDESLSSLSDGSQGHLEKLEDSDDEDDDEYDVARMTEREVREMFNDEVSSFLLLDLSLISNLCPSCPRLQITTQLRCLTTITTSNSPQQSLIAAGEHPAQKLRNPPHLNLKGCLTMPAIQAKKKLTRTVTTPSPCTFPWLLEVPSSRSLAR